MIYWHRKYCPKLWICLWQVQSWSSCMDGPCSLLIPTPPSSFHFNSPLHSTTLEYYMPVFFLVFLSHVYETFPEVWWQVKGWHLLQCGVASNWLPFFYLPSTRQCRIWHKNKVQILDFVGCTCNNLDTERSMLDSSENLDIIDFSPNP